MSGYGVPGDFGGSAYNILKLFSGDGNVPYDQGAFIDAANQWRGNVNQAYQDYSSPYRLGYYGDDKSPMSFNEWLALRGSMQWPDVNLKQNTQPPTPPTPPVVPPSVEGLMKQAADPYGTYGQLGVANPYFNAINQRFNYDPSGLAYGVNLKQSPSWYLPPMTYPNTVLPKISGAKTS